MNSICPKKMMKITRDRMVSIGKILRSLRLEKGDTQTELAYNCGIPPYKISNLENGLCENVGLFTLLRICEGLKVHPNVFFIENDKDE